MVRLTNPEEIERKSFSLIRQGLSKGGSWSPLEAEIIQRVIHATGDFQYQELIRFHEGALSAAWRAFSQKRTIITDVNMVRVGINKTLLRKIGCRIKCYIAQREIREAAAASGLTRAALAIRKAAQEGDSPGALVVIGNAPTSLWETLDLIEGEQWRPSLVIGVPVGLVGAAEAKEQLLRHSIPYITCLGPKGGSSVAVAIVNALMHAYETKRSS